MRTYRCDVQTLQRVGTPDFCSSAPREMQECQYVVTEGLHHRDGARELLAQHLNDLLPVDSDLLRLLNYEHPFDGRRHHVLAGLGDVAQQVAQEVHPTEALLPSAPPGATPRAALEHPLDRRRQAQVGIGDHQAGACEATLYCFAEACGYE